MRRGLTPAHAGPSACSPIAPTDLNGQFSTTFSADRLTTFRHRRCFPSGGRYIGRASPTPPFGAPPELPSLFITPAFAQVSGASPLGSSDMLIQFAPFVVIFAIMYFLILRPQQQRAKAAREMVQSARRGDVVVTSGGLIGKITKATDENEVELEIAPNVRVRLARSGITDVRSKGEPVKDVPAAKGPPAKKDAASS
jgi:preprotein translocase subunit YajC